MKHNFKQIIFALVLSISVIACKPEPKELGPRASQVEGINGTWVLAKIDQIDVNVELAFQESDTLLDVTSALLTSTPLIKSATNLIFRGEIGEFLSCAIAIAFFDFLSSSALKRFLAPMTVINS
jgi:hypothetical protein